MNKFGSAVILAGGKSTRMGFDKQLIKLSGETLIDRLIGKLKMVFDEIIVVTNKPEYYKAQKCITAADIFKERGPLGGVHTGLYHSSSQYVYFIACDMPFVNLEYIAFMIANIVKADKEACVARIDGRIEPFNAFYSRNLLKDIEDNLNLDEKSSINYFLQKRDCIFIEEREVRRWDPNLNMFLNFNTKDQLTAYNNSLEA